MEWETVIGLEIHAQLATKTKIFSGASTAFGAEPNTQACAVDLALPGTLPVFNEAAQRMAIMFGLAINAEIGKRAVFERKNYFYPDLPKGYQTTQLELPIVGPGFIEIETEAGKRSIRIHHAHLEEDAGKSLHEDFHGMSGIDLNRAGTPLIEIVSEPDMRTSKEASEYARKVHAIITTLGICDGNMAEGSMRCDCNVSIRPKGSDVLGTRTELKNINSFRFIERAIDTEVARQIDLVEDGGKVVQETRLYDPDRNETRSMRSKEDANDYRYFPCPDLLPVVVDDAYIDAIRQQLPELPDARKARFIDQYSLSDYDAAVLSANRAQADYYEQVVQISNDAKLSVNWVMGELAKLLNQEDVGIPDCPVTAAQLGGLLLRIKDNTISGNIAKQVFELMWTEGGTVDEIVEARGLKQVTDTGAIEKIIDDLIASAGTQVEQYKAAPVDKRGKMVGFFVGQVMKATGGKANPGAVNGLLKKKLDALCD